MGKWADSRRRCLSCHAVMDSERAFCDETCEEYAHRHGFRDYQTPKGGRDRVLVYAYRLVKGDQISGVPAKITEVKNRNSDSVEVWFANGHATKYPFDKFLNVSHRAGVARPRYRPEHR